MLGNHSQAPAEVVRNQGGVMCGRHSARQLRPACEKGTESRGAKVGRASGALQKETSGLCEVFKARFSLARAGAAHCPLCPSPAPGGAWLCPQPPCCSHPTTRYQKAPKAAGAFLCKARHRGGKYSQDCAEGRINLLCPCKKKKKKVWQKEQHELAAPASLSLAPRAGSRGGRQGPAPGPGSRGSEAAAWQRAGWRRRARRIRFQPPWDILFSR